MTDQTAVTADGDGVGICSVMVWRRVVLPMTIEADVEAETEAEAEVEVEAEAKALITNSTVSFSLIKSYDLIVV